MSTKPLPPHGTHARSVGRPAYGIKGCSCPPCSRARKHYRHRRDLLNAAGRPLMVPAGPATAHLRMLREAGAGWTDLRRATGCSGSTISHLLHGRRDMIRSSVAEAILRVKPADVLSPTRPVSALGSIRRIHALMAIGHRTKDIGAASGVDLHVISDLVNERLATVRVATADRLRRGYRALCLTPGQSVRNKRRAAREGWASPAAWEDIDDPACVPDAGCDDTELGQRELAAIRREEITHLAAYNLPEHEIAARLGMTPAYVHDLIRDMRKAA